MLGESSIAVDNPKRGAIGAMGGREILRCAQDDSSGLCHPFVPLSRSAMAMAAACVVSEGFCHPFVPLRAGSERSEGSEVRIRPAELTHVALPTYW
ncbi:MAG: hypothetical protein ACJ8DI_19750 [Ktedonobacteraceae bacterium]